MTKWKRLRRRKERIRTEETLRSGAEEKEVKPADLEKISAKTQHSQEIEKPDSAKTSKSNTILSQIPRYAYLLAIFALLSGIFFPLITHGAPFDIPVQGIATLILGLAGAILLFKAVTSDNRRGIFIAVGFALIAVSLVLIFQIQEAFSSIYN